LPDGAIRTALKEMHCGGDIDRAPPEADSSALYPRAWRRP
jgi:hypothetical protein